MRADSSAQVLVFAWGEPVSEGSRLGAEQMGRRL